MAIIGTLPNNIQNGQLADATPLMADFNFIVNQVNANANPTGTLTAPTGTRTIFNQPSAPVGWTQDVSASLSDTGMRIVIGAGGTMGGSVLWSNWNLGGAFNLTPFTLSISQMPAHTHAVTGVTGFSNQSLNHTHSGAETSDQNLIGGGSGAFVRLNTSPTVTQTGATDLSNHNHNINFTSGTAGSGASITPSITTPLVKYTDMIMCIKS